MQRRDVSRALLVSAAGSMLVATKTQAQSCATPCYPQTPAELAASVTPTNTTYPEMDIRRYGAVDVTGMNDSSNAINTAFTVNNGPVNFPVGMIRWDVPPVLGTQTSVILRGEGSDKTVLFTKNQGAYTFTLSNSTSCLTWKAYGLTVDGSVRSHQLINACPSRFLATQEGGNREGEMAPPS